MLSRELIGREILDSTGLTVGYVEDFDIGPKGKIIRIIGLPKGVVDTVTRAKLDLKIEDVDAISDVILLKKTKDKL